ncbi:response regulator [Fluoribacter dumoffii]|uniref:Adenylate cyclase 2 n=1 Tax=Fluoribacter dumoffii TaxID=463 RepID=A0A377GET5_9GAMM|nr:adenylate/guanylate cyclase domain-containing protein [Fluoribacter dumoffii]KTC91376.1 guanylate/adenylate cyclase [Fluoribacter dumoffii NY 23]MCW8387495.1 response regulator [Fluoribacter dumoffii]MCW8416997.1 response regulator [Fluoribacter dumoffii]MCW8455163.1 response regulator [Fluoribacter dumoffii]MCW8460760.1 response regulator [Fluoribacter dumoffii]
MEKENPVILVVDDSATMRLITCDALIKVGFNVMQAENGEAALSLLKSAKPDAILLDVEMPGLNGFEVCAEIRKLPDWRYLPIMMVTGLEDYESINKAFQVGATDFTTKPINPTLLGYRVRYMVRTNSYFQELQIAEQKVRALNDELLDKLVEIQQNAIAVARFVPQDFLKVLNRKNIADIKLGDCVEKEMTVLFLDIKSFTTMAERLSPVEIFNLFNTLMSYLDPAILKNSGLIDKYIGDAIMALFNNADDAVASALDMLEALNTFNATRVRDNLPPLTVGIGINTGNLIVGTVGFEERMDCSVISDAVNTASRLESLTRNFNIELIIGEETYEQLKRKEKYNLRFLGLTAVKGKTLPIKVYEVFNHNPANEVQLKKDSAPVFAAALNHYEARQFDEASRLFEQIVTDNPHDLPAKYLLQQCKDKIN